MTPYGIYPRNKFKLPPKTKSGLKGVIYCKWAPNFPWKAYGRKNGWYETIGRFATKTEAARAYDCWAKKVYGPDAYLNGI